MRPSSILSVFLLFSLFYYSYAYFYDFSDGVSSAPPYVLIIKDVLYVFVFAIISIFITGRIRSNYTYMFIPFALIVIFTSVIHGTHGDMAAYFHQNIKNMIIFVPLYYIMFEISSMDRRVFSERIIFIILVSAVMQSIFSIAYDLNGGRLWSDGNYSGFISNPNSFSLILNCAIAIILVYFPERGIFLRFIMRFAFATMTYCIVMATSGSQFAIEIFILLYGVIIYPPLRRNFISFSAIMILVILSDTQSLQSILHSLVPVAQAQVNDIPNYPSYLPDYRQMDEVSRSVSMRVRDIGLALSIFGKGLADILFGAFDSTEFVPMDGQFWVFLYNGGVLTLLAFCIPAGRIYFLSLRYVRRSPDDRPLVALHLSLCAFGISMLASRILMYFPMNFIFFALCGLIMSQIRHVGRESMTAAVRRPL